MSGVSKNLEKEEIRSTPSKRLHEDSNTFASDYEFFLQTVTDESHLPLGSRIRLAKMRRTETRDLDRRSSPQQQKLSYESSSSDHLTTLDYRFIPRDIKDARDMVSRGKKVNQEIRDLHPDMSSSIIANDTRLNSKGDEKGLRFDKASGRDSKGNIDSEKYNRTSSDTDINWSELAQNIITTRYLKSHNDSPNSWLPDRPGIHCIDEFGKVHLIADERDSFKWQEVQRCAAKRYSKSPNDCLSSWSTAGQSTYCIDEVGKVHFVADHDESFKGKAVTGDIKFDPKGNEKLREKDREMKDEKDKVWREKDKVKNDHRKNMQLGVVSNGLKELLREQREVDRWPREIIDNHKENKGKEKNPVKKEVSHRDGMECMQYEKHIDGAEKVEEHETLPLETRKLKDDIIKCFPGEFRAKDRENKIEFDGDKHEKCDHSYDNEAEAGSDSTGDTEKGNESFGCCFQPHKRMHCSRGDTNLKQELHFSAEKCGCEGAQGKAQVAAIVYKPGESMPELLKAWQEFEASLGDSNGDVVPYGPILEIRISPQHVNLANQQVRRAQMWGTDVYTIDSDLVAVLIHTGFCYPPSSPLPTAIDELRATIRVLPPQASYLSTDRNNIHSRAWRSSAHCSYRVESCCIVKKGGEAIKLKPGFTRISGLEPTIAPLPVERTMITRAVAASNASRQQSFAREVSILYNLCNEPWIKYSVSIVADKGMRKPFYTSARLKKGEVLYLETHYNRYELCFNGEKDHSNCTSTSCQTPPFKEKHQNYNSHVQACERNVTDCEDIVDVFRWSRCNKPLPQKVMCSIGIPLPTEHLEVLEENVDWEDIQWSQTGVWISGKEYKLARIHFMSRK